MAEQQQFNPSETTPRFEELGEGGGCQRPGYYPVYVAGAPTGNCASITHFNDFFVEPMGGSNALIAFPSFEEIYGELPEGATTWQIGDFDGDGVREVYAMDADGNPHTVYGYDDSGNVTSSPYEGGTDPALGELISTYGQEAVDDAQRKLEELEKILGKTIDDPLGTLEGIIQKTKSASSGSTCGFQSVPGGTGLPEWVRECVTVGVGLPIPFPLPGPLGSIFKGATVGEIEEAIKNAGHEIGKVLSGETSIEDVLGGLGDWVADKIEDIFGNESEVSINDILGTIGDILVGGGYILAGDLYDEYFKDKVNSVIPNVPIIPFDSSQECQDSERYTLNAEGKCGACIDPNKVYDPSQNKCVPKDDDDDDDDGIDDVDADTTQCTDGTLDENGNCICPDGSLEDENGNCPSDDDDDGTDDDDNDVIVDDGIDCESPLPAQPMSTLIERRNAWNDKCMAQGYCPISGPGETPTLAMDHQEGDCSQPLTSDDDDDDDGTTTVEGCQSTVPGSSEDANGNCVCPKGYEPTRDGKNCKPVETIDDGTTTPYDCKGNPQTSDEIQQCINQGWTTCPDGTNNAGKWISPQQSVEKDCGGEVIIDDDDPVTSTPPEGECWNNAVDFPACQTCPEGQTLDDEGMCVARYTCLDPNATVNADGSCGPCKEGYVFDGAVERCVQESVDPCDNPAYAAANPTECGSGGGSDPDPDPDPDSDPDPDPPSGGGGGGGGGMFRPQAVAPMDMGDPQLLARLEFPIVDYLSESLAKQTKDDLMSGMLTGNIV